MFKILFKNFCFLFSYYIDVISIIVNRALSAYAFNKISLEFNAWEKDKKK